MRKAPLVALIGILVLFSVFSAAAKRGNSNQVYPTGEGVQIRLWGAGPIILDQDTPAWFRVAEYDPYFPGRTTQGKNDFGIKNLVPGKIHFDILIDGIELHSEVQRATTWNSVDVPLPPVFPEDIDVKFKSCFVQLPAGYFDLGTHTVTVIAYDSNPNSVINVILGGTQVLEVTVVVVE